MDQIKPTPDGAKAEKETPSDPPFTLTILQKEAPKDAQKEEASGDNGKPDNKLTSPPEVVRMIPLHSRLGGGLSVTQAPRIG
jgi:hypothetical protein